MPPSVVKVTAAQLGAAGDADDNDEEQQLNTQLEFDLGNLLAYDQGPVEPDQDHLGVATKAFQSLTRAFFKLPFEIDPLGRIAELPPPVTRLPREKPLPKPRPPTKWEIFAQRKGIQKRKRSSVEFDENNQEWRRRYGYKRVDDENDIPIVDAGREEYASRKGGVEDPFSRKLKEKKERVDKNKKQQLANLKHADKVGGKGALPATLRLAASLPEHGRGVPTKRKEMLGELKKAGRDVAVSTASMGRHDRVVKGEDVKARTAARNKKMKGNLSSTVDRGVERAAQGRLVDNIISKNADDILDIGKAIRGLENQAREGATGHRLKRKGANKKGALEKASGKSTLPSSGRKKAAMKEQGLVDRHNKNRGGRGRK